MFASLRRLWPFVLRRAHEREVEKVYAAGAQRVAQISDRLRDESRNADRLAMELVDEKARRSVAERAARDADERATSFQARFADYMAVRFVSRWGDLAERAMRTIEDAQPRAFVSVLTFGGVNGEGRPVCGREDIELSRFMATVTVGLSDGCPPELVADRIAGQVRAAVLAKWRDQSILNTKGGPCATR
jgi:hypothetical protein